MSGRLGRPGQQPGSHRPGNILLGIVLVARGKADGLGQFGNTVPAFLASLAPLVAFPLVGGILMLAQGGGLPALSELMATFCALLTPPVVSWELARRWQREAQWLHYATAANWCQWAIPVVAMGVLLVLNFLPLAGTGLQGLSLVAVAAALIGGYALWLHWFIARRALAISRLRAVVLVLLVNLATVVLVVGPRLLALALARAPAAPQ